VRRRALQCEPWPHAVRGRCLRRARGGGCRKSVRRASPTHERAAPRSRACTMARGRTRGLRWPQGTRACACSRAQRGAAPHIGRAHHQAATRVTHLARLQRTVCGWVETAPSRGERFHGRARARAIDREMGGERASERARERPNVSKGVCGPRIELFGARRRVDAKSDRRAPPCGSTPRTRRTPRPRAAAHCETER
jgi:hypothetical protein